VPVLYLDTVYNIQTAQNDNKALDYAMPLVTDIALTMASERHLYLSSNIYKGRSITTDNNYTSLSVPSGRQQAHTN